MKQIEGRGEWRALCAAACLVVSTAAPAAIYTCTDGTGKKLTSDRPIPACSDREQRVLNADGSVKRMLPPNMTADERSEQEARDRQAAAVRAPQQDAIRRDRNLVARFPNEATHSKARAKALDDARNSVANSEKRLAALAVERKPLLDEAEFYANRQMPAKLKQQLEANDAAAEAQRVLVQNQQAEIGRINGLFDVELARLRRLWSGTPAGSLGALPADAAASEAKKTAATPISSATAR
jgi:hypothetical protein